MINQLCSNYQAAELFFKQDKKNRTRDGENGNDCNKIAKQNKQTNKHLTKWNINEKTHSRTL